MRLRTLVILGLLFAAIAVNGSGNPPERTETFQITLRGSDSSEMAATVVRTKSAEQIPFWIEYEVLGSDELGVEWICPETAETVPGSSARFILRSNASPYSFQLQITADSGVLYTWEEADVSFPLHARMSISLNATGFPGIVRLESVTWSAANGDPDDQSTFPIAEPNAVTTTMISEWPNVLQISCELVDGQGQSREEQCEALVVFPDGPPWPIRGSAATFHDPFYGSDLDTVVDEALSTLAGLGFNSVVTSVNWWYGWPDSNGDFSLGPLYQASFGERDPRGSTAADEQLRALFDASSSTGFQVHVQMIQFPYRSVSTVSRDYGQSGWGPNEGFRNTSGFLFGNGQGYQNMLLNYVPLFSESPSLGTVFLGAEVGNMEVKGGEATREFFRGVLDEYRSAGISSPLSYALCYWHNADYPKMPPMYLENLDPEVCGIPWADMDYVALTFYPKLTDDPNASTLDMYNEALSQAEEFLIPLYETYGLPLFIEDFYCMAYDGCAVNPVNPAGMESGDYDFEEQRRWLTAWLRAFATINQDAGFPLIEGVTMGTYRMMPNSIASEWLPESERLGPCQWNNASGRPDLQKLAAAWFRDVPLR